MYFIWTYFYICLKLYQTEQKKLLVSSFSHKIIVSIAPTPSAWAHKKHPVFKSAIYALTLILAGFKCDGLKLANQSNTLWKANRREKWLSCAITPVTFIIEKSGSIAKSLIWTSIFNKTGIQKHGGKKDVPEKGKKRI